MDFVSPRAAVVDTSRRTLQPSFAGRRGHPLFASSAAVDEFRALAPDQPAHTVVRRFPDRVLHLPVADRMVVADFDTPEDLKR